MTQENKQEIDEYLKPLIDYHRASSRIKLAAAWDGLTIENQIKILISVNHISDEVISKGLSSENAYIRYLTADRFVWSHDEHFIDQIAADSSILVRTTRFPSQKLHESVLVEGERYQRSEFRPGNFFLMPEEEQILKFSEYGIREGEEIEKIIEWGIENEVLTDKFMSTLLEECSYNFKTFESYIDDYDYSGSKGLKALWQLALKLPHRSKRPESKNPKDISYGFARLSLVWSLPGEIQGTWVADEVFYSLEPDEQEHLLEREEAAVSYRERKKIVLNCSLSDEVRRAAASNNFDLSNADLSGLSSENHLNTKKIIKGLPCATRQQRELLQAHCFVGLLGITFAALILQFLFEPEWLSYTSIFVCAVIGFFFIPSTQPDDGLISSLIDKVATKIYEKIN